MKSIEIYSLFQADKAQKMGCREYLYGEKATRLCLTDVKNAVLQYITAVDWQLNERSRVRIGVTNREFIFGPSLEIRLEKKGSSEKLRRTVLGGGTAVFDRRLSRGTYTLRVSSDGESVPYRLTYQRNDADDFDPFD